MTITAASLQVDFSADPGPAVRAVDVVDNKVRAAAAGAPKGGLLGTMLGTAGGVLTGGLIQSAVGGIKSLGAAMLGANADAETMRQSLEVAVGSVSKANDMFAQLQKFAASTPFEFPELMQTAISLESLGVDAMGLMDTIGNTAAATGKSLDQVTQAVLDAMVGETERLKEFGIRSSIEGDKMTLSWMQNGEQMSKTIDKNNQDVIRSTLQAIWNEKYGGAMQKQAQTFAGQWSTLQDNINLTLQGMSKGIFAWAKDGLGVVNDWFARFNDLTESGLSPASAAFTATMAKIRELFGPKVARTISDFGRTALGAFDRLRTGAVALFTDARAAVARHWGTVVKLLTTGRRVVASVFGWILEHKDAVIGAIKGVVAGFLLFKTITTATSLVSGFVSAIGLITSPIGLAVAALAAFGAAYQTNFLGFRDLVDSVVSAVRPMIEGVVDWFDNLVQKFGQIGDRGFSPWDAALKALRQKLIDVFGTDNPLVAFVGWVRKAVPEAFGWIRDNVFPVLETLKNYFGLAFKQGDSFNAVLTKLPDGLQPVVKWIGSLVGMIGNVIQGFQEGGLKGAIGAFFASIPDVISSAGNYAEFLLGLGARFVGWLVEGLASKAGDILQWASDNAGTFLQAGSDALAGLLQGAADKWPEFLAWLGEKATDFATAVGAWKDRIAPYATAAFGAIQAGAIEVWTTRLSPWIQALPGSIGEKLGALKDKIGEIAGPAWEELKTTAQAFWDDTLSPWLTALPGNIATLLNPVGEKTGEVGTSLMDSLRHGAQDIWNNQLGPWLSALPDNIIDSLLPMADKLDALGQDGIDALRHGIETVWNNVVGPWLQGLPQTVWDFLNSPFADKLDQIGQQGIDALRHGLQDVWNNQIQPWFQGLPQNVMDWLHGPFATNLDATGQAGVDALRHGMQDVWNNQIVPWIQALPQNVMDWLHGPFATNLDATGQAGVDALRHGMQDVWNNQVQPWITALPGNVVAWLATLAGFLQQTGTDAFNALRHGMQDYWNNTALPWLQGLPGEIGGLFGGLRDTLTTAGSDALDGLRHGMQDFWNNTLWPWVQGLPGQIAGAFANLPGQMVQAGKDAAGGLMSGLGGAKDAVFGAGQDAGDAAAEGTKDALDSASPSKVFMRIGEDALRGLIIGLGNKYPDLKQTLADIVGDGMISVAEFNSLPDRVRADAATALDKWGVGAPAGHKFLEDATLVATDWGEATAAAATKGKRAIDALNDSVQQTLDYTKQTGNVWESFDLGAGQTRQEWFRYHRAMGSDMDWAMQEYQQERERFRDRPEAATGQTSQWTESMGRGADAVTTSLDALTAAVDSIRSLDDVAAGQTNAPVPTNLDQFFSYDQIGELFKQFDRFGQQGAAIQHFLEVLGQGEYGSDVLSGVKNPELKQALTDVGKDMADGVFSGWENYVGAYSPGILSYIEDAFGGAVNAYENYMKDMGGITDDFVGKTETLSYWLDKLGQSGAGAAKYIGEVATTYPDGMVPRAYASTQAQGPLPGLDDAFGIDDLAAKRMARLRGKGLDDNRIWNRMMGMFQPGEDPGDGPEWLQAVANKVFGSAPGSDRPFSVDQDLVFGDMFREDTQRYAEAHDRFAAVVDKLDAAVQTFQTATDRFGQGEALGTLSAQIVLDGATLANNIIAETNAQLHRSRENVRSGAMRRP